MRKRAHCILLGILLVFIFSFTHPSHAANAPKRETNPPIYGIVIDEIQKDFEKELDKKQAQSQITDEEKI